MTRRIRGRRGRKGRRGTMELDKKEEEAKGKKRKMTD